MKNYVLFSYEDSHFTPTSFSGPDAKEVLTKNLINILKTGDEHTCRLLAVVSGYDGVLAMCKHRPRPDRGMAAIHVFGDGSAVLRRELLESVREALDSHEESVRAEFASRREKAERDTYERLKVKYGE